MSTFKTKKMVLCKSFKANLGYRLCSTLSKTLNKNLLQNLPVTQKLPQRCLFWEKDRKGGYNTKEKISTIQHIRNGMKEFKSEFKLWTQEVKETLAADPLIIARPENFMNVLCLVLAAITMDDRNQKSILDKVITNGVTFEQKINIDV